MEARVHYRREEVISWLNRRFPDIDWGMVGSELPLIIWRSRWDQLADRFGLPYTKKYMQTLDCKGEGPLGSGNRRRSKC